MFETLIVGEFLKACFNNGMPSNLYFWRDNTGLEIDLVIETAEALFPVEVKSGSTVTDELFAGLRKWCARAGPEAGQPRLVYGGAESYRRSGVDVRAWFEATNP